MQLHRMSCVVAALSAAFAAPAPAQDARTAVERIAPDEVARSQHHYREVELELLERVPAGLTDAQRTRRAEAIAELARYRDAADYPVRAVLDGVRRPMFEDAAGRHCAVAHLMATFGAEDLLAEYAAEHNHAYIMELADDPRLGAWVDAMGLTMHEAARIHLGPPLVAPGPPIGAGGLSSGRPGGTVTTSGDSGAAAAASGAQGPASNPGPRPGATSGGTRRQGGATTRRRRSFDEQLATISGNVYIEPWWEWWEMNKHQFLIPHPLIDAAADAAPPSRYHFGARLTQETIARKRAEVLPLLYDETAHADERVRARAAMAIARLARADAAPRLVEMLSDPSLRVRNAAILALGATGDMQVAQRLVALAESGDFDSASDVSPNARAIALLSLGIGRHYGMPELLAGFADGVYVDSDPRDEVRAAAFLFDTLAPSDDLQGRALDAVSDETLDVPTRCRAIASLGRSGNPEATIALVHALDDRDLEIRRAAALALSGHRDEHVLQRLLSSFEMEAEPMTRGFLLIAIGEQATPQARDKLIRILDRGDKPMRPWAALGLGVLARRTGDVEAKRAIRKGLRVDANHDQHGSYVIASGIALDTDAIHTLRDMLVDSPDPRMRMFAAHGLGLMDDDESRKVLLHQLEDESWSFARAAIAQALGHIGHEDDGTLVVDTLREIRDPQLQSYVASAVGFHGTPEALDGLIGVLRDDEVAGEARAAAVDAIGLLLDGQPGMLLSDVASASNFRTFPKWMAELLGEVTL